MSFFAVRTQYRPSDCGIVAIVRPAGFLIVHMPLQKLTEHSASSSQLIEINVKAISSVYITSLSIAFVCFDPFGSSI
jgi:hypothetical protein